MISSVLLWEQATYASAGLIVFLWNKIFSNDPISPKSKEERTKLLSAEVQDLSEH